LPRAFLFEFEDLKWFPQVIREGMMDYLRLMIGWTDFYQPCAPIIKEVLSSSRSNRLVELCAGGGGGITKMLKYLAAMECRPSVMLTDLYPNISRRAELKMQSPQLSFKPEPVNALNVPEDCSGVRTMFSALHHFKPQQVKALLADAMSKNESVAFFDAGTTSVFNILSVVLLEPISFLLLTPLFRPFRWSRLFFTYVVPLIILCTIWDGSISVLRFYTRRELEDIVTGLSGNNYIWKVGRVKNKLGIPVHYITGHPS
jgi:hypothetical protein